VGEGWRAFVWSDKEERGREGEEGGETRRRRGERLLSLPLAPKPIQPQRALVLSRESRAHF
jgi:hypothetical protein